ncbi:MAG: hypothetical protein AB1563_12810, partial [Bacillota bacterium]
MAGYRELPLLRMRFKGEVLNTTTSETANAWKIEPGCGTRNSTMIGTTWGDYDMSVRDMKSNAPKRLRFLLVKYELYKKRVLDMGCGDGYILQFFGKGSLGVDMVPEYVEEARAKGLDAVMAIADDPRSFASVV